MNDIKDGDYIYSLIQNNAREIGDILKVIKVYSKDNIVYAGKDNTHRYPDPGTYRKATELDIITAKILGKFYKGIIK